MLTENFGEREAASFARDGFLVVPNVVDAETLAAVRVAFAGRVGDLLSRYAQLGRCEAGAIAGMSFDEQLTTLLAVAPEAYQHIDISLPVIDDMAAHVPEWQDLFGDDWRQEAAVYADESIFRLVTHPNILGICRHLLGDEVVSSPVQHVRIKPPQNRLRGSAAIDANTARTLWHQDEGVVSEDARGVDILTVWIAITEATPENGCMQAVSGSHLVPDSEAMSDFGLTTHCPGKGDMVAEIYIPDSEIDKSRLVPLVANAGDVVLLHKRTVHGSGENRSAGIRWSFDMRYQPSGTVTGRDFFPACPVFSESNPEAVIRDPAVYRRRWLNARDDIIEGRTRAVFNTRWNRYQGAPICA